MMTGVCVYMKPSWKVKGFFDRTSWKVSDVQIVRKTWVLSSFSVSVSVSLCLCVLCVVCCCGARGCGGGGGRGREEGGKRRRGETNRTVWAKVSLKIAQTGQPFFYPVADSLRSVRQENWS